MPVYRGILVGLSLAATVAQAQVGVEGRTGAWRTIPVPPLGKTAEVGPVPELRVAPGSATLLELPERIVGRDGFKVFGGEGRVDAQQVNPTTLVLVTSREVGPERIPLAVATIDGRRYPFLLATRPGVVDIQVRVVFDEERRAEHREDAVVAAMLNGEQVFSRQYERPREAQDWTKPMVKGSPFVGAAVRMGRRYFLQVRSVSSGPWKVDQAKLKGPDGELLKVESIHWAMLQEPDGLNRNINVIVAEVPEDASPEYALRSIELIGQDASLASLDQQVSLP